MNVQASPLNCGKQSASHKFSSKSSRKDLWLIAQQGSIAELESALILLKKNGGNIDSRNIFGLTPLHIATWKNSVPIVKRLLEAGSDPDARDGESGWSSLHRALHFGHLAVASVLLQFGASLSLEDSKYRTPVDLLSGPVLQAVGDDTESVAVEVYSWGNGTNYQLGTGNSHIAKLPCKVDTLHDSYIKLIAASKFHSVAVGSQGELYTWGFGRGGRLGHPDFDIHSGQAAITTPRRVTVGLGSRHVKIVAAAKHHTVIATENGEVFTWGSNREGQLGYTSVDTQPTPRRVSSLKSRVIAVAAANKHSAAVTECGEIFTWGCNKEGQLGYGTSNSASNYIPRMVEYLKGKVIRGVSAAKYHTVVLVADSEVYTWGHRLVTPKRVVVARCLKKSGNALMKFHRTQRLHLVSVVAGTSHSTAMSEDGTLFYWVSSDPDLRCQQVYSLCGKNIVSISTGKYWTSAVTITGDVYMWDGKNCKNITPIVTRVHGVKHVTSVAVGETHMLMLCSLYHPMLLPSSVMSSKKPIIKDNSESEEIDDEIQFDDLNEDRSSLTKQDSFNSNIRSPPSLKSLCEKTAAEFIVEPKNALQLLEIADSLEADELRKHCENVVLRNLDYLFTVAVPAITSASLEILAKLEKLLDEKSSDAWCYHHLPTHTATFPAVIYSDEECDDDISGITPRYHKSSTLKKSMDQLKDLFSQGDIGADEAVLKQVRAVRKKLQQIEMLESKQANGHTLDDQQIAKLQTRTSLEFALSELGFPVEKDDRNSSPLNEFSDLKGSKKSQVSKKEKRKNKIKEAAQSEALTVGCELSTKMDTVKGFGDGVIVQSSEVKKDVKAKLKDESKNTEHLFPLSPCTPKASSNIQKGKASGQKKKIKKGGLSMFLSGALDDAPKPVPPPPPTPKNEGPAWGGAKIAKGPASLLDIQNEQKKVTDVASSFKPKEQSETSVKRVSCGPVKSVPLASGPVKSNPLVGGPHSSSIAVGPTRATSSLGEKSTPPWSTSPVQQRPSLRDIQMQQVGPRSCKDRASFTPNNIILMLAGAGMLWMGWTGFNGGGTYAANIDASLAIMNTHICAAASLLVWLALDITFFGKPSVIGGVQGMITGLVCITPAAGLVQGWAAIIMGILSGSIPWYTMMVLHKKVAFLKCVDDTMAVFHTHAVAGSLGGILSGIFAQPRLDALFFPPPSNITGWIYGLRDGRVGAGFRQVGVQLLGIAFIVVINVIITTIICLVIRVIVPLRLSDEDIEIGDDAIHGEEAYALWGDGEIYENAKSKNVYDMEEFASGAKA